MLTDQEINSIFRECAVVDDDGQIFGLDKACRKVIEANNKKILADLKPVASSWQKHGKQVNAFPYPPPSEEDWANQNRNGYWINKGFKHSPLFSADTVSALIQRNEALEARVRELEAQAEMDSAQITFTISRRSK